MKGEQWKPIENITRTSYIPLMSAHLLDRRSHRVRPALAVLGDMTLPLARLHELCGPARHTLAMLVAAATQGPVLWISPTWCAATLNPDGMQPFVDPARFVFAKAQRPDDILWTLEETLRSGAAQLAVADLSGPPGLTAVRRLHLAAETGAAKGAGAAPLGIILTPETGGAPGIETRWHMAPRHGGTALGWTLDRARARTAPIRNWRITWRDGRIALSQGPATVT